MSKQIATFLFILLANAYLAQGPGVRILKSLNQHDRPAWDKGMKAVSVTVFPMVPLTGITILSHGYLTNDKVLIRNGYKTAIALGFASVMSASIKRIVKRPRPYITHPDDIIKRDRDGGPFSFPSGHTTSAFVIATSLSLSYQKWYVAAPSFLYASFVAYSRMRLGMHYPGDVIMGIILGVGSGVLTWQVDRALNGQ
ncbi:MAG: phosphatase PAP2 family protein [Bacteroidia bacterium]|nr:phosphatase PAP2 family protein [Bacteroidia bacterium]